MAKIGFIGLGNMGGPMAANLVRAGHEVSGFDLAATAVEKFTAAGGRGAASAEEAVVGAEVVISMLPAGRHVAGLYLGERGLLARLPPGTLVIDSSTIDAETARQVAAAAVERDLAMIDAPVSGGVAGAAAGTLTFICGGEEATLERARAILEPMAKAVFHAGGAGAGQVAKMCNNMLLGILMTGTAEALSLGEANGLDPAVLSEIMKASSGNNWALQVYNPWPGVMENAPASRDYQGGFAVDLIAKDLGLANGAALNSATGIPLGALVRQLYLTHAKQGAGGKDFSSILAFLRGERPG
ncbi:3-hydroxyisobutyrate dehydrogenase [Alkalilimnicola sp. S0819]|uniref:3-hydroxyisobutyrate dehydrogenase n=1 Tax=Alkalilimnicola sp. S0819 TaxID=2613922 RepID=UPI0012617A83|nr:3-hydroxyisobutyrate dehydrogenase [Alkalilimnicola sp. S0819]KAB7622768.1 3-hydroxyisobutyrate dehydrogenase [Alkalilimnicola sp. S0819]MPQ17264.1 3-hydroxyisobutyrate dehydrogenase [Alkalilimnicola sp. S0819]